eukprot:Rmarinus@m.22731
MFIVSGPTDLAKCVVSGTGLVSHKASAQVSVAVATYDAYGNPTSTDADSFELQVAIPDASFETTYTLTLKGSYHDVSYVLPVAGTVSLSVATSEGFVLSESSIEVSSGSPDASHSNIDETSLSGSLSVGSSFEIVIYVRDANDYLVSADTPLSVTLYATEETQASVRLNSVTFMGSGMFVVTGAVETSGTYSLSVKLSKKAISNSGVLVSFLPIDAHASNCFASNYPTSPVSASESATGFTFTLNSRDVYGNEAISPGSFDLSLGGACESGVAFVEDTQATVAATMAGVCQVVITVGGEAISGSPLSITIEPGAPSSSTTTSTLSTSVVPAGEALYVDVSLLDAYSNPVEVVGTDVAAVVGVSEGVDDGETFYSAATLSSLHQISVEIPSVGEYLVYVVAMDVYVSMSTVVVVASDVHPPSCYMENIPEALTAGETAFFNVYLRDAYGNNITTALASAPGVEAILSGTSVVERAAVHWDNRTNSYICDFALSLTGAYLPSVSIEGTLTDDSNAATISVSAGTMAISTTTVYGDGLRGGLQDELMPVLVQLRDEFGNELDSAFNGTVAGLLSQLASDSSVDAQSIFDLHVADAASDPGLYEGEYMISDLVTSTTFRIEVTIDGQFVPFKAEFVVEPNLDSITLSANLTVLSVLSAAEAGASSLVSVVPSTASGQSLQGSGCLDGTQGHLNMSVVGNQAGAVVSQGNLECLKNGAEYRIYLVLEVADIYAIRVTYLPPGESTSVDVANSPATLAVVPASIDVDMSALALASSSSAPAPATFDFVITLRDSFGNEISATAALAEDLSVSASGELFSVEATEDAFASMVELTVSGAVAVDAYYRTTKLPGSGVTVDVDPGVADAARTELAGNNLWVAGETSTIQVALHDTFGNVIPSTNSAYTMLVVNTSSHALTATLQDEGLVLVESTVAGSYAVSVGTGAGYSPSFEFTVSAASGSAAHSVASATADVTAGDATYVFVTVYDEFGNAVQPNVALPGVVVSSSHDASTAVVADSYLSGTVETLELVDTDDTTSSLVYLLTTVPSGVYTIEFSVLGEVSPSVANISAAPKAALEMTGAALSDSLSQIAVKFSGATNRARQSGSFACDRVLQVSTIKLLGEEPSCAFSSDSKLSVYPGFGWSFSISDDTVGLLEGVVFAANENSWSSAGSISVDPPANPMAPLAVLEAPAQVGSCSDLDFLDLTPSVTVPGLRQYAFALVSAPTSSEALRSFLASSSGATLSVSSSLLASAGTYVFNGTVTDSVGQSSTTQTSVVKSESSDPLIQLQRSRLSVTTDEQVYVKTTVSLPSCAAGSAMTWQWTQEWADANVGSPAIPEIAELTGKDLVLDPNTLTAGYEYIFTVTGKMTDNPSLRSSDSVTIVAESPSVSVSIVGGSRAVPGSQDLVLEALACDPLYPTLDCYPDETPAEDAPAFTYYWTCSPETMCADRALQSALVEDANNITIPAASLVPGDYEFTVAVVHPLGLREASTTETISVSDAGDAVVEVSLLASFDVVDPVPTDSKLTIESAVTDPATGEVVTGLAYEWHCLVGDLGSVGSTLVNSSKVSTSPYSAALVITAGSLTPGQDYTLSLQVQGSNAETGSGSLSFVANAPPTSGTLTVQVVGSTAEASDIVAAETNDTLLLTADGWLAYHNPDTAILSYLFGYYQGSAVGDVDVGVVLVESLSTVARVKLPAGSGANNTVTVYVDVSDSYGSTSRRQVSIQVFPTYFASTEEAANTTSECIDVSVVPSEAMGDTEGAQTAIAVCESYLSDEWLSEDEGEALRRRLLDNDAADPRAAAREYLVEYLVYLIENFPPAVVTAPTISKALSVTHLLSRMPSQLPSLSVSDLAGLLADLLSTETTARVGGLSSESAEAAVSTIAYLREAGTSAEETKALFIELSESLLLDSQCDETGVTANAAYHGVYMSVARLSQSGVLENDDVAHLSVSPAPGSPLSCSAVLLTTIANDDIEADSRALSSAAVIVGSEVDAAAVSNGTVYWFVTIPRDDPPSWGTAPMCVYLVEDAWVWNNETCYVMSATSEWVQVAVASPSLTVAIQDVDDPCLGATSCLECNAVDHCGWCASSGSCLLGDPTQTYYESACPAEDWHYESCPCSAYSGCNACVSRSDATGRAKAECGWCPTTSRCFSGDESGPSGGNSCPEYDGSWTYGYDAPCGLVDECAYNLHDCHEFASCTDTAEYYECVCDPGYVGDGYTCEHGFVSASLSVLAPSTVDVTQTYKVVAEVSDCADCDLFDMRATWSVSGPVVPAGIAAAVNDTNQSGSSMVVSVPALTMEDSLLFSVTVCVDDICHVASTTVALTSCISVVWESSTVVDGKSPRDRDLKLTAKAATSCSDPSVNFMYNWDLASMSSEGNNLPSLTVPAWVLNATQLYDIALTACVGDSVDCEEIAISVYITHSSLVSDILTPDGQQTLDQGLLLDATPSHDPDDEPLSIRWSCVDDSGATCFDALLSSYDDLLLSIAPSDLQPGLYSFTLDLSTPDGRSAIDVVVVEVVAGAAPGVTAYGPSGKVSTSNKATLTAVVDGTSTDYEVLWTQVYNTSDPDAHVLDLSARGVVLTSTSSLNFVIAPFVLLPGESYRFRATVSTASGVGWSEVSFTINRPPTDGDFAVSPSSGYALDTVFTLDATLSWKDDDPGDYPLSYRYLYYDPILDTLVQLKTTTASSIQTTLPGGADDGTLTLYVAALDYYGATSAMLSLDVTVTWPEVAEDDVAAFASTFLDSAANSALQTGNPDSLSTAVDQAAAFLNKEASAGKVLSKAEAAARAELRGQLLGHVQSALDLYGADAVSTSDLERIALSMRSVCSTPSEFRDGTKGTAIGMMTGTVALLASMTPGTTTQYSLASTMAATLGDLLTVVPEDAMGGMDAVESAVQAVDQLGALVLRGAAPEEQPAIIQTDTLRIAADILEENQLAGLSDAAAPSVSSVSTEYVSDPYNTALWADDLEVTGQVVTQSLFDGVEVLRVSESTSPAVIMIPSYPSSPSEETAQACTYWDGTTWSSEGCVRLPEQIPPGVEARWVEDFDYSNNSRLQMAWYLELLEVSYPTCYESMFVAQDGTILKEYKSSHETYVCGLAQVDNSSCYWDTPTQRFLGLSCLHPDETVLECHCNHLTSFAAVVKPPSVHVLSISDFSALKNIGKLGTTLGVIFGMFAFAVIASFVAHRRYKRVKAEAVRRLCTSKAGFRIETDPLCWTWSLEAFREDDGRLTGTLPYACHILNMSVTRALFITPSFRYEYENVDLSDKNLPDSRFVGTCLILAFMEARGMMDRETLSILRTNASRYFAKKLHSTGRFDMDHVIQIMKLALFEMTFDRGWSTQLRVIRLALLQSKHGDWLPSLDVFDCLRAPVGEKPFELKEWINQKVPPLEAKRRYMAYVAKHTEHHLRRAIRTASPLPMNKEESTIKNLSSLHTGSPAVPRSQLRVQSSSPRPPRNMAGSPASIRSHTLGSMVASTPGYVSGIDSPRPSYAAGSPQSAHSCPNASADLHSASIRSGLLLRPPKHSRGKLRDREAGHPDSAPRGAEPLRAQTLPAESRIPTVTNPVLLALRPEMVALSAGRGLAETTRAHALKQSGIEMWDTSKELMAHCPKELVPSDNSYREKIWTTALVVAFLKSQKVSVLVDSWRGEETTQAVGEYWLTMVTGNSETVKEVLKQATKCVDVWGASFVSLVLREVRAAYKGARGRQEQKAISSAGSSAENDAGGNKPQPQQLQPGLVERLIRIATEHGKRNVVKKMEDFHPALKALFMGSGTTISPVPMILTLACHFITMFMVFIWFYYSRSLSCCDW